MSSKWLTLTILGFLVVQQSQSEVLECNVPNNFTVEMSSGIRSIFFDSHLQVSLDLDAIEFHSFPETSYIHIKADDVSIGYKGQVMNQISLDSTNSIDLDVEKYSLSLLDQISGIARKIPMNETSTLIYDCRIVLFPHYNIKNSFTGSTSNAIRRRAESCIEDVVCARFARINRWKFIEKVEKSVCLLPIISTASDVGDRNAVAEPTYIESFQTIINKLVDIALSELVATLQKDGDGMITIPDIEADFSTGKGILKTDGKLNAYDGKFGNLATLKRASDAVVSAKGYKYVATCSFALTVTKLNYKKYKLKYGMIKVDGHIDASIDGISLITSISLDYTQPQCIAKIEKLKVTEFGKIKVDISGLGPLNSMAGSIFGWIGEKWKTDLIDVIERKLSSTVQEKLSAFDCEKFRP